MWRYFSEIVIVPKHKVLYRIRFIRGMNEYKKVTDDLPSPKADRLSHDRHVAVSIRQAGYLGGVAWWKSCVISNADRFSDSICDGRIEEREQGDGYEDGAFPNKSHKRSHKKPLNRRTSRFASPA